MPSAHAAYDLLLLLDPAAGDEQRGKLLDDVKATLKSGGADIASTHDWGQRRTAYEIKHRGEAHLHHMQFVGPAQVPARLDHQLHIADGVIRHRIIRRRRGAGAVPDIGSMPQPAGAGAPVDAPPPVERL